MNPTHFIEANALLALQEGEEAEAAREILSLLPSERVTLHKAAFRLQLMCAMSEHELIQIKED